MLLCFPFSCGHLLKLMKSLSPDALHTVCICQMCFSSLFSCMRWMDPQKQQTPCYTAALKNVYCRQKKINEKLPLIFCHMLFSQHMLAFKLWFVQSLMSPTWQKPKPAVWFWSVGTLRKPSLYEASCFRGLSYIMIELSCVVLMLFLAEQHSAPEQRRPGTAIRKQREGEWSAEVTGSSRVVKVKWSPLRSLADCPCRWKE